MVHSVLAYAKKPVGAVMMRPILLRLEADERYRVCGSARLFGERRADGVFREAGLENLRLVPKWMARLTAFDAYISADFGIAAPRSRTKIHVFHGVSFRNHGIHANALRYDLLLCPGPYMRRRFEELGIVDETNAHRFPVVGMPKLDDLANRRYHPQEILSRLELDPSRPTLLYAPTWLKKMSSLERHGMKMIEGLLKADVNVLVKLHDNALDPRKASRDWAKELAAVTDPRLRFVRETDIVPLMAAADLLVSDASSVTNEFALLDRPILFMEIDKLEKKLKSKADLDTWGRKAGEVVEDPSRLPAAIDHALANPAERSEVRRALARDLFFEPGTATDRAVAAIRELVERDERRP